MSNIPSRIGTQATICAQLWSIFTRAVEAGHTDIATRTYKRWRKATIQLLSMTDNTTPQQKVEEFRDTLRAAEFGSAEISFSAIDESMEIKGTFNYGQLFKRFIM